MYGSGGGRASSKVQYKVRSKLEELFVAAVYA